jgi:hypothetical protein
MLRSRGRGAGVERARGWARLGAVAFHRRVSVEDAPDWASAVVLLKLRAARAGSGRDRERLHRAMDHWVDFWHGNGVQGRRTSGGHGQRGVNGHRMGECACSVRARRARVMCSGEPTPGASPCPVP